MILKVNENLSLTPYLNKDKANLVKYINHPEIANNTLTIPFPYQESDADSFFSFIREKEKKTGKIWNWVIRNKENNLIGSIGLMGEIYFGNPHRDAFGYWIAEEFWGKGMMTEVVKCFSEYCLQERGIVRLEANVFSYNIGSMKVLERAGFEREGYMKKMYLKNEKFLDTVLYAKTK